MKPFIYGITRFPVLGILFAALVFTSCKKDALSLEDELAAIESMENDATSDVSYSAVTDEALDIAMQGDAQRNENFGYQSASASPRIANGRLQQCFVVTLDTTPGAFFPATVTIDFKDGCPGRDGRSRKGKVITKYTGKMRIPGSKATTTFENFYIDDTINVDGIHVLTNITSNVNNPTFEKQVINGKLTTTSGRWVKRNFTRTVSMIKGAGTRFDRSDDEFAINGNGSGENSRGKTWTHNITQSLIRKNSCFEISRFAPVSGVISFRHNAAVGSLDYGDGSCDRKAILTINGRSKEITLR